MTKEEALNTLLKNGWSVKDAETDIKEWSQDNSLPLDKSVELAIEVKKAITPEREYFKDKEGHIVDSE